MRASAPQRPEPRPRLRRWPLVALVLPALAMTVLSVWSLARDWHNARLEAASRAQDLVSAAASRIRTILDSPSLASPSPLPSDAEPVIDFLVIGPGHQLLDPPPDLWPPHPNPITADSTADPFPAWHSARSAFDSKRWTEAIAAYDTFLSVASREATPRPDHLPSNPEEHRRLALAAYERALAIERIAPVDQAVHAFHLAFERCRSSMPSTATSEAGVPILHLVALKILDLTSSRFDALPGDWRANPTTLASLLASSPPSPYLDHIFTLLEARLPSFRDSNPGLSAADLLAPHHRNQRRRSLHAAARLSRSVDVPWPDAFWIQGPAAPYFAIRQSLPPTSPFAGVGGVRRLALIPGEVLRRELAAVRQALDPPGNFALRLNLAGETLIVASPTPPGTPNPIASNAESPLASGHSLLPGGATLELSAALARPDAYYAEQRRRQYLLSGFILLACLGTFVSLYATRRALDRQLELNRHKSNFVSSVSHELRAPLGSIRLLAEGLERGTVADEARRLEYARLIGQETRRLGSLVENVLDYSRIDQGRKEYQFEPTDIVALVGNTARLFLPLAEARQVQLRTVCLPQPALEDFPADGRTVQQALLNLLDNALKHSPAGSTITLEAHLEPPGCGVPGAPPPSRLRLSVGDEGPGIPPEDHRRIFEPFFRRGSELRRETQGIGIGLGIVRHIAEAHGGTVEVLSTPGHGATFSLILPMTR